MKIEDEFRIPETNVGVPGCESGEWVDYSEGTTKFFLHETVGFEAATHLLIWELLEPGNKVLPEIQVTRGLNGKVVGIISKPSTRRY